MIAINLIPESVAAARRARVRAKWLLVILILLASAVAVLACSAYIAERIRGADADNRLELSSQIASTQQKLLRSTKDLDYEKLRDQQNKSAQLSKVLVFEQMIKVVTSIPQHVTLSSVRINQVQIILSGVANSRSDIAELVSALRAQFQTTDISIEILKDIALERYMLQEFVIRGERPNLENRGF